MEESFYSYLFEDEYSETEDEEEILNFQKIPRHISRKIKKNACVPQITEDTSESEEDENILPSSKVVIRHLPPEMTGELFFQFVSPLPAHNYKYFVEASKEFKNMYGTAYINFMNRDDGILFMKQYDGHIFHSSRGAEYKAIVEFAPSAQVPKEHSSNDYICGKIDYDPDYLEFLESLKIKNAEISKEEDEVQKAASRTFDPLVYYLNTMRSQHAARGEFRHPQKYYRKHWRRNY
ncbi:regulator of nonsense transcripts 3B-like [Argiope bruennichi]|uniref:regulator of nonsense transcripts 3B-like n=1 Tax=Argiope bruennichi TaxID=94029 RepID=UPI002494E42B|nr:regulator of nonsense transcripts 3B-like [Argiope bruennichi]XP_055939351.1 regulator of nonsense transcripts 3B-like [Argiope bruennichi]